MAAQTEGLQPSAQLFALQGSSPMIGFPGVPKPPNDKLQETDEPSGADPAQDQSWSPPVLVRLEPGSAKHERAKIAFELLRSAQAQNPKDPRGSQ